LGEVHPLREVVRPRVGLACSQVRYMDRAGIDMLLSCMEQAMKRNGDLKLGAVSPKLAVILELMRVDRLFEVFGSNESAVQSFHAFPSLAVSQDEPWYGPAYGALGKLKTAS